MKVEAARNEFKSNPAKAQEFLSDLRVEPKGFCLDCQLAPSKENGYIQLSYGGANKFCVLGEMVGWASGIHLLGSTDQISHLCHNPKCIVPAHVVVESVKDNNSRKGCKVWVDCPHCPLKIFICEHNPACIKFAEGYGAWEEFRNNKVH